MLVYLAVGGGFVYALVQILRPFIAVHGHYRGAKSIGLPVKLLPFPPGLFSFFAFQILRSLRLMQPGTKLHKLFNMGRPDGYTIHEEMGDVFVTVTPAGLGLIVADPQVAGYVNGRRSEFPKPPNTGAIINLYGRNVINSDGDVWRLHRKVTGPVFSERIHRVVWQESKRQTKLMLDVWSRASKQGSESAQVDSLADDTLRLGLHVITGSAYGCPLEWDDSPPHTGAASTLTYRRSLEELTKHLMEVFLTPHWFLKLAPRNSKWGRAWEAFQAFGSYMEGMLKRERERLDEGETEDDNLLTHLIRAENVVDSKLDRPISQQEIMGNAFIFLFAGHETTANTLHYSLLLLALNPSIQDLLLEEIDTLYEKAKSEGRDELDYELDYSRFVWAIAIMSETLRVYSPTGITNKWTSTDQPITYNGQTYVIPSHTRISINGTGIHSNPKVWGDDAEIWRPSRWITTERSVAANNGDPGLITPPPTPGLKFRSSQGTGTLSPLSTSPASSRSSSPPLPNPLPTAAATTPAPPSLLAAGTPSGKHQNIIQPARGSYLPFSEGSRMCSGKKFSMVEFCSVISTLLRHHRVELLTEEEGWTEARVKKILSGRKAGALTMQPPENIPVRFVKRR